MSRAALAAPPSIGNWRGVWLRRALTGIGTALALIVLLALVLLAFRVPPFDGLRLLAEGAFGDRFGLSRTAVKTTPLLLTGLGAVVAWRGGLYNIGGEGQYIVGGLAGCLVAKLLLRNPGVPAPAVLVAILAATVVGGALWAGVAGWLYVRRGVEVVISTILLNFVAAQLLGWAVSGPLQEAKGELPLSDRLPEMVMLPRFDRQMEVHGGVFVALLAAAVVFVYLFQSRAGFRLRLVGDSPRAARANLVDAGRTQMTGMLVSGALCGLAGGIEYTGTAGQLGAEFSQQWGFLGIPVALLGGLHPLGVIPSALYFGGLLAGSENLSRFSVGGTTLIYVVQACGMLGLVALRAWASRRPKRVEAA